jgi:hypothetical protein
MKSVLNLTVVSATLLASVQAFAASGDTFECKGMGDQQGDTVTLKIDSRSEVSVDGQAAKLDENYDPRLNEGYLRFEYVQSDEGTTEVLVQRGLVYAAKKGFIKIQNRGEGFSSEKYACALN